VPSNAFFIEQNNMMYSERLNKPNLKATLP
jgi:hypothetical protein